MELTYNPLVQTFAWTMDRKSMIERIVEGGGDERANYSDPGLLLVLHLLKITLQEEFLNLRLSPALQRA